MIVARSITVAPASDETVRGDAAITIL